MRYRFVSSRHRELFRADPDKYAPQFGGQCAMNLANGNLREIMTDDLDHLERGLYVFASTAARSGFARIRAQMRPVPTATGRT